MIRPSLVAVLGLVAFLVSASPRADAAQPERPGVTPDAPLREKGYSVSLATGAKPPMQVRFVPAAGE